MEQHHMPTRERPPSYAQSHDPQSMHLPAIPTMELPRLHRERTLPPVSLPPPEPLHRLVEATPWPSSNPLTAYYRPTTSLASPTTAAAGVESPPTLDTDSANSEGRSRRAGSVLSMEDPDVRIAAEALGDLRADFVSSPPQQHSGLPNSSPARFQPGRGNAPQPEPLLSLLTTSHPLLGTAIGGSLNAYSASKNYSPRFKSSVEYIEKGLTPVVNTVGSVGRATGVEGGVRWFLGGRRPSRHTPSAAEDDGYQSNKRRKVGESEMDVDNNVSRDAYAVHRQELYHRERRASQVSTVESLPAYDEQRSPNYESHAEQSLIVTNQHSGSPTSPGSTWHSRLVLSTSGLSVAMSEESLRSLKYCLSWLRCANEHIGMVIEALKAVLDQFEGLGSTNALTNGEHEEGNANGQLMLRSEAERTATHAKIAELKSDVLKTLKDVVDVVSRYAGGALPANARLLVRRHLTSLPQRFRLASSNTTPNGDASITSGDKEVTEGARKVMVLAKEGLDMMAQVSGVLDGTIVSAEEWCERVGRRKRSESDAGSGNVVDDTGMVKEPLAAYEPAEANRTTEHDGNVDVDVDMK